MNPTDLGVVLVTTSSEQEARAIAMELVASKLAACVNFTPISSIYTWEGKINQDREWQLIIKTNLANFESLEAKIRELHSYTVPEIIALPIVAGYQAYLDWVKNSVIR